VELLSRDLGVPPLQAGAVRPAIGSRCRGGPASGAAARAEAGCIRRGLAGGGSPWTGEGHRTVWAQLRVIDVIRVARKRVLREHSLLSPHRARTRSEGPHDRNIITQAPNVMWATNPTQIATVQDGKVWLFGVIEHWNAELVGWHVAKRGTRFESIQGVAMAVRQQFGTSAPASRAAWHCATTGQQLHGGLLPEANPLLGHRTELRLRGRAADHWRHRALLPHLLGAGRARPHLPDHR
jgi:hypothetical protein